MEKIVALQAYRIWANTAGTLQNLDPEYLHDMRVATRRLRSALRFIKNYFDEYFCEYVRNELAWLAGYLGRVRDMDVFIETLEGVRMSLNLPEGPCTTVIALLKKRHYSDRRLLNSAIKSKRTIGLMERLFDFDANAFYTNKDRELTLSDTAARIIRRELVRSRKMMKNAEEARTDERLHMLRIALKRLRYACEFFSPLYDERMRKAVRIAVKFQDCLGEHQDAIVAVKRLGSLYFDIPRKLKDTGAGSCIASIIDHFKIQADLKKEEFLNIRGEFDLISNLLHEVIDPIENSMPMELNHAQDDNT